MNFFKTFLASILGVLAALFLFIIIVIIYAAGQSSQPEPYVKSNSVLKISLRGDMPDRDRAQPFGDIFGSGNKDQVSLVSLKENLEKAAAHDNVAGVWLQLSPVTASWAQLEEARQHLKTFRDKSDKFVYAYTDDIGYNEKAYFLATAADSVFAPKETFFEFDGFFMQTMFMKGFYEKIGLEAEVVKRGKYKSAIEPLIREDYSEENEYQMTQLVNGVADVFLSAVEERTGNTREELNGYLNEAPRFEVGFAHRTGLVDSLIYPDQFKDMVRSRLGLGDEEELNTVDNSRYSRVARSSAGLDEVDSNNKIAVIHANGTILPVEPSSFPPGGQSYITATGIQEQLDEIEDDDNVKAIVLRVNSPGGAGTTSDLIWRMIKEQTGKMPVVASMGSVAASGGYYISMAADTIVAEPSTITGSIGVFARQININELMTDKLEFSFDGVKSHEYADWLTPTRSWKKAERATMQKYVDQFYETFVSKAAESRGVSYDYIDERAQGRVWNGADAQNEKLVDVLGGMSDAVQLAADRAGLAEGEYKIEHLPKPENVFDMLMQSAQTKAGSWMRSTLGMEHPALEQLHEAGQSLSDRNRWVNNTLIWPYEVQIQ